MYKGSSLSALVEEGEMHPLWQGKGGHCLWGPWPHVGHVIVYKGHGRCSPCGSRDCFRSLSF